MKRVVITFRTTTQAMSWERACREAKLPGRLIPLPVEISSDCGLAWLIEPEEQDALLTKAGELGLVYEQVVELGR